MKLFDGVILIEDFEYNGQIIPAGTKGCIVDEHILKHTIEFFDNNGNTIELTEANGTRSCVFDVRESQLKIIDI